MLYADVARLAKEGMVYMSVDIMPMLCIFRIEE